MVGGILNPVPWFILDKDPFSVSWVFWTNDYILIVLVFMLIAEVAAIQGGLSLAEWLGSKTRQPGPNSP